MATNYPGGLDTFANPGQGTQMGDAGYYHDELHAAVNDAVEAIEGELGTDPSGVHATVGARFAAQGRAPFGIVWPKTGYYYVTPFVNWGTGSTAVTANRLYYWPFYAVTAATTAALAIRVTVTATGNARVGLYSATAGSDGLVPSTLIVDAGTASTGGSTGVKDIAVAQALTANTWYFTALVTDAAPQLSYPTQYHDAWDGSSSVSGYYHSYTYAALPESPSALTRGGSNQDAPRVGVKL